ncbi:MAG: histidine phosphatase family protein [Planctomycetota bacterium]
MSALDLVIARHGNTFGPGDTVTWVGRNEDLPLVEQGLAQAEALGDLLVRRGWRPQRVLASSLQRTRGHAERALFVAGWSDTQVEADPRLDEIDYGPWGGLSSAQIEARGDGAALQRWADQADWPAAFAEREEDVRARVQGLATELAQAAAAAPWRGDQRVLLVSSNGVMRYLLDLVPGELARRRAEGSFKVGTGRVGRLRWAGGRWQLLAWNVAARDMALDIPG